MPPKQSGPSRNGNHKSNSRNPSDWKNYEFANVKLNNHQEEEFHEWFAKNSDDVSAKVSQLIEEGHKVTLSPDTGNACIIASVTCKDELSSNFGYVLTSRSDDWWEAIALCAYKAYVICAECDWSEASDKSNWG